MNRLLKLSAILALALAIALTGCKKSTDNNNSSNAGNSGGGQSGKVTVTTYNPTDITESEATCGVEAYPDDINYLLEIGVCWSTSAYPTVNANYKSTKNVDEPFICTLTDLEPETNYHVRAYALYNSKYYYGEDKSFKTIADGGGGNGDAPIGAINGLFSVSANRQVYFSKGNLQYKASTDTWRFANNQWDYIGEDNVNISSTYDGWIDLFGWGTSGYNHGAVCYQPWSTSDNSNDYDAYGDSGYNLFDKTGRADWGYNSISNGGNIENIWRTPTNEEWTYVLTLRNTSSGKRFAKAKVNGINGLIILPDDWDENTYDLIANNGELDFEINTISVSVWNNKFKTTGAVFLPASGYRGKNVHTNNQFVDHDGDIGTYWSSSSYSGYGHNAYYVSYGMNLFDFYFEGRDWGNSVRLVQDYQ